MYNRFTTTKTNDWRRGQRTVLLFLLGKWNFLKRILSLTTHSFTQATTQPTKDTTHKQHSARHMNELYCTSRCVQIFISPNNFPAIDIKAKFMTLCISSWTTATGSATSHHSSSLEFVCYFVLFVSLELSECSATIHISCIYFLVKFFFEKRWKLAKSNHTTENEVVLRVQKLIVKKSCDWNSVKAGVGVNVFGAI